MKKVAILGSTGSIGTQALGVAERYPDRLRITALAASTSIDALKLQVIKHNPDIVSVRGAEEADRLSDLLSGHLPVPKIVTGVDGLREIVLHENVDSILNGIVGSSGLVPTLTALKAGREVLLANKESLVMAGELIRGLLDSGNGSLVPVDSEHSAIWQCMNGSSGHPGLKNIILTASGGPFRDRDSGDFENLTVEEALSHPTWKMGPKITIDSATLMNKGLEIIEARYLFNIEPERIKVVIHPSSIIHSLVEFLDGSQIAQLSHPTMEIPIQYALLGGDRLETTVKPLDLAALGKLEFFPPDPIRFPALDLARLALNKGGTAPAVLNGANEEAVGLFLAGKINFPAISRLVREALDVHTCAEASEEAIFSADSWARGYVINATNDIKG